MRLFLAKMNRQYSWNICFMLSVCCSLPPSLRVPFPASQSPLMHSSHTKYVCITATSSHQTRLAIIFFIFHFLSFTWFISHATFYMMDLLWTLFQLFQHLLHTVMMKSSPETAFSISKHSILTHSPLKTNLKM